MKEAWLVLQEQFKYFPVMWRLANYEKKARFQNHALGNFWLILNPVMQVLTYWVVFGFNFHESSGVPGVPYLAWLIVGLATWLFINTSFMDTTWSISSNLWQIARMKFPVSIMPMMRTLINVNAFVLMLAVGLILSVVNGLPISIYWIQVIYYFMASIAFLYVTGIFNATITVLIPDYQQLMQTILRFVFWISGALWALSDKLGDSHPHLLRLLELNPFYYLVTGMRDAFFSPHWFWEAWQPTVAFWLFILIMGIVGSHLHLKFRAYFADFI